MGQQFTRGGLSYWSLFPAQSRILVYLCVPEHDFDVHDMLPCGTARQDSPGTSWT